MLGVLVDLVNAHAVHVPKLGAQQEKRFCTRH